MKAFVDPSERPTPLKGIWKLLVNPPEDIHFMQPIPQEVDNINISYVTALSNCVACMTFIQKKNLSKTRNGDKRQSDYFVRNTS